MSNKQTVQAIYAAFGRGDIPAILGHLSEIIEWEYGTLDSGVPWLQPRRGLAEVPKFFESLGALDFQRFQPMLNPHEYSPGTFTRRAKFTTS